MNPKIKIHKVKKRSQAVAMVATRTAKGIALSESRRQRQDAIEEAPVTSREALNYIRVGLQMSVQGKITGITDCTVDDNDVFRGKFHQRVTPTQVKSFEFTFGENEVSFKPIEKQNKGQV